MSDYKVESKRIGSHVYTVTQLNAVTGRKALLRLLKVAGPAFEAGLRGGQIAGFKAVADSLTELELDYFCDLLSAQTTVRGGDYAEENEPQLDKVFPRHFADDYFEMLEWIGFALEVNFGSFFRGLAKRIAEDIERARKATASSSTSPATSTSGSGD